MFTRFNHSLWFWNEIKLAAILANIHPCWDGPLVLIQCSMEVYTTPLYNDESLYLLAKTLHATYMFLVSDQMIYLGIDRT